MSSLCQRFLDKCLNGCLGGGRDNGAEHLAVFKEHQRGDGVDAEALDELWLLVVVDLASDERVGVLLPHLVKGRGNTAAVGAPLRPEIHQHGLVRAENICTNPTRVRRVLAGLKKAGMVETREGLDGGYRLTADPASLTLRQVAEAVNTRFVDCAWHSGDIDQDCAICSGMAGVMDALYRQMDEQCAAYLEQITITDIETQLFTQK